VTARVDCDLPVPMRDGVVLRADVWRPADEGRRPTLVFRTPYSKREGDPCNERTFRAAVARGYAVVVQDVRGRYQSEGQFDPYRQEGPDGYDTVEWAASQPWSDGSVGMFGLSYPGAVQWLAAVEAPPHLKAIAPAMTFSSLRRCVYPGGVFDLSYLEWSWVHIAPDARARLGMPGPRTPDEARAEWERLGLEATLGFLPLRHSPLLAGVAPYYGDWLRHPPHTPWWAWGDLEGGHGRTTAAVLNLSGWHDEPYGVDGAVRNYQGLRAARAGRPDPRTRLVLGPWSHGVEATARASAGARDGARAFGPAAAIDYDGLVLDWMDRHVRGVDAGDGGGPPVRVFVMGADRWRDLDDWPPPQARPMPLYLDWDAAAGRGRLDRQPARPGRRAFVADPARPVPDRFETNFGAYDLSYLAERPDVLTFDSPPLADDVEVTGDIAAELEASSDAPDFDLYALLLDVEPGGRAFNLMSAGACVLRARYRRGFRERRLLRPGQAARFVFDRLRTSNLFRRGHRVRLCVLASWHPAYPRNLQTGAPEADSAAMRPATIAVHFGGRHASRLVLPVIGAARE
jgi:putative CocE/NonD family hydrolase